MEIKYHKVSLDEILRYYVKDFELPKDMCVFSYEAFVDIAHNKVMFEVVIAKKP